MGAGASIGDVKARLTLDTAAFDGPMKQSATVATASGRSIEQAAKKAADAQAFAAKFAGDTISQQTLRILDARKMETAAAADMRKAQALNKVGYLSEESSATLLAAALQRLTAAKAASAAASATQAKVSEVADHATITRIQATSAAVRSLEGNPGIRATERFLTTIPGLGTALMAAFPLIGGLAFGAMIVEMTSKVVEFIKKVNEMPDAIRRGFESMHLSAAEANDQLRLTNDELQNSINKLQGTPENNLAIALDEARIKADDLAKSLEEDVKKVKELLAANNISELGALLGKGSTGSVSGSVNAFQQKFSDIGYKRSEAARSNDTETVAAMDRELAQVRQQALDWAQDQLNVRNNKQSVQRLSTAAPGGGIQYQGKTYQDIAGDQTANANILQGFRTTIQDSQDREQLKNDNGALVAAQKAAEEKKRLAAEGLAASNKAAQERLRAMEVQLNEEKQQQGMSVKAEYDYWAARTASFKVGSSEYASVVAKASELAVEGARKAAETIKRFQESQLKSDNSEDKADEIIARFNEQRQKDAVKAGAERNQDAYDSNQLYIQQARNEAREQEARVTDQAGRSITKYAAAIQLAQIHAKEFAAVMLGLQSNLGIKQYQQSITPTKEGAKGVAEAQAAVATTVSQRTVQSQADQDDIYGRETSAIVGATDALNDFIRASRDSAAEMRKFIDGALNGVNGQIIRAISGQRTSFGSMGAGLARGVAGMALQKGEGSILGMIPGLGPGKKPTGAKGDPIFVAFDGSAGGSAGAAAAGTAALAKFFPGSSAASSAGISSFVKSMNPLAGLFSKQPPAAASLPVPVMLGSDAMDGGATSVGADAVQAALYGVDKPQPSAVGSTVQSLTGAFLKMLPGFADGGMISANTMSIIGENGPELFMPSTSGSIMPNKSLGGIGGDTTHNWNIDARGSSDPAAVRAAVQEGIMAAAPHIAAAGVKASQEQRLRSPLSRR